MMCNALILQYNRRIDTISISMTIIAPRLSTALLSKVFINSKTHVRPDVPCNAATFVAHESNVDLGEVMLTQGHVSLGHS